MGRTLGGFSLVEAVAVLAIAAVGLALALPSFVDALQHNRLATSMHMMRTDMGMARNTAIMRSTPVIVCPGTPGSGCHGDGDWSSGWMVYVDMDGNRRPDQPSDILRVSAATGSALTWHSTRAFLRYQPDGRSAHSNLTVNVCAAQLLVGKLVVNNIGRVRSERPRTPAPCPRT